MSSALAGTERSLNGLRVIVTGAGSGIGLATARAFANAGARVGCNHLPDDDTAIAVITGIEVEFGGAFPLAGNVSVRSSAEQMIADGIAALGGLDVLVNNAGTSGTDAPIPFSDLGAISDALWQTTLDTNLIGAFNCCRAAENALRAADGAIVNVASIAGLGGDASSLAYAASKAALINLTRNLAKGLGPQVRVNAVAPGLTRTPWTDDWPVERKANSLKQTMLGRMVEAEDVAEAVLFLSAQNAITGQTLQVDCGRMF